MNNPLTFGSLFDGSRTFPIAGMLSGIVPVWKSEIEPLPITVTEKHLPFVKHLGDINHINGVEIEPIDIMTFGSPCTDLSVAGKRQGLNATRSGLFFQAVRIIKEMRCATNGKYRDSQCGKTSQEFYPPTKEKTYDASLKNSVKSKSRRICP